MASPPVVFQRAFAPRTLELTFALGYDRRVIEIPRAGLSGSSRLRPAVSRRQGGCGCRSFGHIGSHFGLHGLACFFFLLLLQGLDDFVDGLVTFVFGQLGQPLQAVLQFDGRQMRFQFGQDA